MTSKTKNQEGINEEDMDIVSQKRSYAKRKRIRKWIFIGIALLLGGFALNLIRLAVESVYQ